MRPNFLIFVTDQQRADWLSCMGNPHLKTPNIDKIASRGVVFERAYCNTPLCMPSRYTMWTGLHSSSHGMRTNGVCGRGKRPVLPEILSDAGYRTISVGKIHLSPWNVAPELTPNISDFSAKEYPESVYAWREKLCDKLPENYFGLQRTHFIGGHGCDCYGEYLNELAQKSPQDAEKLKKKDSARQSLRQDQCYYSTVPCEHYYNRWMEEKVMEELDQCDEETPFFMWCSFPDPHFPFGPPKPYQSMYDAAQIDGPLEWEDKRAGMNAFFHSEYYQSRGIASIDGGPTELSLEQIMETKALAYGMVKGIDDSIGRIMAYLEQSGKAENTVVMFLSDHGELMGDHGMYCKGPFHYEGLLKVPFIISCPGQFRKGVRTKALVCMLDFLPTILELAKVEYPFGKAKDWEGFFAHQPIYQGVRRLPGHSLVPILKGTKDGERQWVLVENDDDIRNLYVRTLITDRYKLTIYEGRDWGDLFDLEKDPTELHNCWNETEYQEVKNELMFQMAQALVQEQDRTNRRVSVS